MSDSAQDVLNSLFQIGLFIPFDKDEIQLRVAFDKKFITTVIDRETALDPDKLSKKATSLVYKFFSRTLADMGEI